MKKARDTLAVSPWLSFIRFSVLSLSFGYLMRSGAYFRYLLGLERSGQVAAANI